jgi:hypothetical protein
MVAPALAPMCTRILRFFGQVCTQPSIMAPIFFRHVDSVHDCNCFLSFVPYWLEAVEWERDLLMSHCVAPTLNAQCEHDFFSFERSVNRAYNCGAKVSRA